MDFIMRKKQKLYNEYFELGGKFVSKNTFLNFVEYLLTRMVQMVNKY